MTTDPRFLILNPVKTSRAAEFEAFIRDVLQPAVTAHRPDIADRVRLWKASEPEPGAALTIYAFVAEGVSSWEDLDLMPAFTARFGEAEAQRSIETFGSFFVERRDWAAAWAEALTGEEGGKQYGWQMEQL